MKEITYTVYDNSDLVEYQNYLNQHPEEIIERLDKIEESWLGSLSIEDELDSFEYLKWKDALVLRTAADIIREAMEN